MEKFNKLVEDIYNTDIYQNSLVMQNLRMDMVPQQLINLGNIFKASMSRYMRDVHRVIEIGSGLGVFKDALKGMVGIPTIIQTDKTDVFENNMNCNDNNSPLKVRNDATQLPFKNNSIEGAVALCAFDTLENVDLELALKQLYDALEPDKYFLHFMDILPDYRVLVKDIERKGNVPLIGFDKNNIPGFFELNHDELARFGRRLRFEMNEGTIEPDDAELLSKILKDKREGIEKVMLLYKEHKNAISVALIRCVEIISSWKFGGNKPPFVFKTFPQIFYEKMSKLGTKIGFDVELEFEESEIAVDKNKVPKNVRDNKVDLHGVNMGSQKIVPQKNMILLRAVVQVIKMRKKIF